MGETRRSTSNNYIASFCLCSLPKNLITTLGEINKFSHYQHMTLYFILQYKWGCPNKT